MPVVAAIVLNDGQATPVAHTFSPSGPDKNGVTYWFDRSSGFPIGFPSLSMQLREPPPVGQTGASNTNRAYRATIKIGVPVMEVNASNSTSTGIPPAPFKSYESLVQIGFVFPERSSLANRKDVLAFAKNYLAHANVTSLVNDLESVWG